MATGAGCSRAPRGTQVLHRAWCKRDGASALPFFPTFLSVLLHRGTKQSEIKAGEEDLMKCPLVRCVSYVQSWLPAVPEARQLARCVVLPNLTTEQRSVAM